VKALHRGWRRHRRYEQISHRGWIILPRSAARAGTDSAPATRTLSRPYSASAPGTRARGSRIASSFTGSRSGDGSCDYLLRGCHRRLHRRLWLRRLDWWNRCRCDLGHHRRVRLHSHELEMLLARARPIDAASATSGRARPSTADHIRTNEIR
jgi:hypothetical protein